MFFKFAAVLDMLIIKMWYVVLSSFMLIVIYEKIAIQLYYQSRAHINAHMNAYISICNYIYICKTAVSGFS